jgi:hypothetical protein
LRWALDASSSSLVGVRSTWSSSWKTSSWYPDGPPSRSSRRRSCSARVEGDLQAGERRADVAARVAQ